MDAVPDSAIEPDAYKKWKQIDAKIISLILISIESYISLLFEEF